MKATKVILAAIFLFPMVSYAGHGVKRTVPDDLSQSEVIPGHGVKGVVSAESLDQQQQYVLDAADSTQYLNLNGQDYLCYPAAADEYAD